MAAKIDDGSLAGDIVVYGVFPLLVAAVIAIGTLLMSISRRLSTHDTALALLVSEVTPPNKPNLRELISDVRHKQGIDAALFEVHVKTEDDRYDRLDKDSHRH